MAETFRLPPRFYGYPIGRAVGALGEAVVRGRVVVPGNASDTAANLRSMEAVAVVTLAAALQPLSGGSYLNAFATEQLSAMARRSIRSHTTGFAIALVFFGVECVILGYLTYRSDYMPRVIGVLMQVAGICYVINSFAFFLSPPLSSRLFPAILIPSLIAELSLALWLLVKGVRAEAWDQRVHRELGNMD